MLDLLEIRYCCSDLLHTLFLVLIGYIFVVAVITCLIYKLFDI